MPRHRNPRYAPESLERRLHPDSGVTAAATSALVATLPIGTQPVDDIGTPPTPLPPPPSTGPSGPALTPTSPYATATP